MPEKLDGVHTNKPNGTGFARIVKTTRCSIQGMKSAYKEESAFRQEFWLFVFILPLSTIIAQHTIIAQNVAQWALFIGCILLVLKIELINSAIEALTDRVSLEHHIL